jgi:hypothetical protein
MALRLPWMSSSRFEDGAKEDIAPATAVVAGHSHTVCFGIPFSPDQRWRLIELSPDPKIYGLQWPRPRPHPRDFIHEIARLSKGKRLFLLWGGNEHLAQFLLASSPLFDFVSSELPHLPLHKDAVVLPESLVATSFEQCANSLNSTIDLLRQGGITHVSLLGSPPPKGDDEKLRPLLNASPAFKKQVEAKGAECETIPLTPPQVRLKLWALHQKVAREVAARKHIHFIAPPIEAQDQHGFLKEELWAPDATHANRAYGALYLAKISHHLRDLRAV